MRIRLTAGLWTNEKDGNLSGQLHYQGNIFYVHVNEIPRSQRVKNGPDHELAINFTPDRVPRER